MHTTLGSADFKGTGIKTAFEQMRANAIINADNNARGLSIINFNITAFLARRRQKDALFILGLWAISPIKSNLERFKNYPTDGQKALEKRAENLIVNLQQRPDFSNDFAQELLDHIKTAIAEEINHLTVAQTA